MELLAFDARPQDYPTFARLFPELRVPDPVPTEEQFRARILPHAFFLREGEAVVAYAFWHALGDDARVSHVIVEASAQGRGVGGALMRELGARARAAGCKAWELNVKPENLPAIRLYTRCGMREVSRGWGMHITWAGAARLPRLEGATPFRIAPEAEAGAEATAGLLTGQLGAMRAAGRILLGLKQGEALVGVAAFDPTFPGAMPFVARGAAGVGSLLEAMRPHALPEFDYVRFFAIEREQVDATEAVGAKVLVETLKMAGPIAVGADAP